MLLNFKLKNFRSFRNEVVFTMLSSLQKTHNDYIVNRTVSGNRIRVLMERMQAESLMLY